MEIIVTGKIVDVLPARTGISQSNNQWVSQDFVIETEDDAKICFNVFGDKAIQNSGLKINAEVCVALELESKPYSNGEKYFTSVKMKRSFVPAEKAGMSHSANDTHTHANIARQEVAAAAPLKTPPVQPAATDKQTTGADDLPF